MFPITISIVERNPADLSAREHNQLARESFGRMGGAWQSEMFPKRFTEQAPHYPRKKRTSAWLRAKARLFDRGRARFKNVDNVLTGNMGDILSRPGLVRAYPTRATVTKQGPRYITMRPYKSNQPDKWAELVWLAEEERARLGLVWMGTYEQLLARRHETRTFTTG